MAKLLRIDVIQRAKGKALWNTQQIIRLRTIRRQSGEEISCLRFALITSGALALIPKNRAISVSLDVGQIKVEENHIGA